MSLTSLWNQFRTPTAPGSGEDGMEGDGADSDAPGAAVAEAAAAEAVADGSDGGTAAAGAEAAAAAAEAPEGVPRAVPEKIGDEEDAEQAAAASADDVDAGSAKGSEHASSIRAPVTGDLDDDDEEAEGSGSDDGGEGDGEEGEDGDGEGGDDDSEASFGSAQERTDAASVGSFGSPRATSLADMAPPVAKPTAEGDDFSEPPVVQADGQDGQQAGGSAAEADGEVEMEDARTSLVREDGSLEIEADSASAAGELADASATDASTDAASAAASAVPAAAVAAAVTAAAVTASAEAAVTASAAAAAAVAETATASASAAVTESSSSTAVSGEGIAAAEQVAVVARPDGQEVEVVEMEDVEDEQEDEDDEDDDDEWVEEGEEEDEEEDDEGQDESLAALVAAIESDMQRSGGAGGAGGGANGPRTNGAINIPGLGPSGPRASGEGGGEGGAGRMPASMQQLLNNALRTAAAAAGADATRQAAAAAAAPVEETETQRKLTDVRVKMLRFARRLGQSENNTVVAQVFYRLDLAERLQGGAILGRGAGLGGAARLERVRARADELEAAEGSESTLGFDSTVLLIGKAGTGKTATIRSLLGLAPTDAVRAPLAGRPTTRVTETVGQVAGATLRFVEVPGLHSSVADMRRNLQGLQAAKRYLGKRQPDVVLYVDRLDWHGRDYGDMELVRPISDVFGPHVWVNTLGLLTHGSASPPEDATGRVMSYEMYTAHRTHALQQTIRQAAGDMRLSNPVVVAENHPACRTNRAGEAVLPNGQVWKAQLLLTCMAGKCLAEANSLMEAARGGGRAGGGASTAQQRQIAMMMGGRVRMPPLAYLLTNLLQRRAPVKLPQEQDLGDDDDDDVDAEEEEEEEEVDYDKLPPFRRLMRKELEQLSPAQRKEYQDELAEREKLFQKKQWKEELQRRRELRKRAEAEEAAAAAGGGGGDKGAAKGAEEQQAGAAGEEEDGPGTVPVAMPEMEIPLSFDSDHPTHRYRFLNSDSSWLMRPVLESNGWDHDLGYDGFQVEKGLAIMNNPRLPAQLNAQVTKDKRECTVQVDAATSIRHGLAYPGSFPVSTVGLDLQVAGRDQRVTTLRADTRLAVAPHNRLGLGASFTSYPELGLTYGLKVEDTHTFGKRVSVMGAAGLVKFERHMAKGLNLELQLRPKDYPVGRNLHQLGLSLLDWQGDLVVGANLSSQLAVGNGSTVVTRANINNRGSGTISVRAQSSEHLQLALVGLVPLLRYFLSGGFLWGGSGQGDGEQMMQVHQH